MRLFVKRDLDGFFGLFIDNLVQLLLMVSLCGSPLCGMTGDDARFLTHHILPGAAVSILIGNLFYAWQAHRLAKRTGRDDVTALAQPAVDHGGLATRPAVRPVPSRRPLTCLCVANPTVEQNRYHRVGGDCWLR